LIDLKLIIGFLKKKSILLRFGQKKLMANEAHSNQLAIESIQNGEQPSIRSAALWRSCEECDDWYHGDCFLLILNDSFVCKKCS
jgi:hypothetical protein